MLPKEQEELLKTIQHIVGELDERLISFVQACKDEQNIIDTKLKTLNLLIQTQRNYKTAYEVEAAKHEETKKKHEHAIKIRARWQFIAAAFIGIAIFCGIIIVVN